MSSVTKVYAIKSVTTDDCVACLTEEWLEDIMSAVSAKDMKSITAYVKSGKCIKLKEGIEVTITKWPGMFGSTQQIMFEGTKLWVNREGTTEIRE